MPNDNEKIKKFNWGILTNNSMDCNAESRLPRGCTPDPNKPNLNLIF